MSATAAPESMGEAVNEEPAASAAAVGETGQSKVEAGEQKETKATQEGHEENLEGAELSTLTPALSQREREEAAARIKEFKQLPAALRGGLAALVASSAEVSADGKARVPVDEAIRAIEDALPEFLRVGRGQTAPALHPDGDAFFSGEGGALSDVEAEELARGQLARSGLLRGQRVRVAE